MATLALYGLIALIAVAILFALGVWLLPAGEQIAPPAPDLKPWLLSDQSLTSEDIVEIKLPVALRGYRFAETDLLLDRLTEEIRVRDVEIGQLRSQLAGPHVPLDSHVPTDQPFPTEQGVPADEGQPSEWAPSDWAAPAGWTPPSTPPSTQAEPADEP